MTEPKDGHGQRDVSVSERFIAEAIRSAHDFPDDARMVDLKRDIHGHRFFATFESEEWDEDLEGANIPEHK
jgi:hypothetical protein